jgi:hypothetical protein
VNITENIIMDLLPAYLSGEASVDTKRLVEDYFRLNPRFAAAARLAGLGLAAAAPESTQPALANEKIALARTKRLLRWQQILLALASTFSLNALSLGFSFDVGIGGVQIHWLSMAWQRQLVGCIGLLSVALWLLYFRASRTVRNRILT